MKSAPFRPAQIQILKSFHNRSNTLRFSCFHRREPQRNLRRRTCSGKNFKGAARAFRIGPVMLSQTFCHGFHRATFATFHPFHGANYSIPLNRSRKK